MKARSNVVVEPATVRSNAELRHTDDLAVCDIMGDWGRYQWSLTLFSAIYSALAGVTVLLGPMLTPNLSFVCDNRTELEPFGVAPVGSTNETASVYAPTSSNNTTTNPMATPDWSSFATPPYQCSAIAADGQAAKCLRYIYDDGKVGLMLTNRFDLVCDREWLRSMVSSSSLVGMLISSVTLGVISDRFGRLRCTQLSFLISMLATLVAILARDYYLFNLCIVLISYAQVGTANALCTLLMESTSPRFRYVPILEYGVGWALGNALVPLINSFTHDYRYFMGVMLVWQALMLPWLHWGIFESIRWLLSEGHISRAQIELRRACRINRVQTDARLAQDIAQIQAQRVRKASRVIEDELAPSRLAQALESELSSTVQELDMLSAAIKRSFFGVDDVAPQRRQSSPQGAGANGNQMAPDGERPDTRRPSGSVEPASKLSAQLTDQLSPTLARKSFSLAVPGGASTLNPLVEEEDGITNWQQANNPADEQALSNARSPNKQLDALCQQKRQSLTTQGLIRLAMKYSKTVERAEEGSCFLIQMFHPKLWRQTVMLSVISVMYETSYYGFVQANNFVGKSAEWNYFFCAISELSAAIISSVMLAFLSRKFSIISSTLVGSFCCLAMALTYQLIPDHLQPPAPIESIVIEPAARIEDALNFAVDQLDSNISQSIDLSQLATDSAEAIIDAAEKTTPTDLVELKQMLNLAIMIMGKFVVTISIQIVSMVAMEGYPNNLRQTAMGAIVFVARLCSIGAPFLFNDTHPEKLILRLTLYSLGAVGLFATCLVPFTLRDYKDKELSDQLNDIEDDI